MLGIVIAQLFRLQHTLDPTNTFGLSVVGARFAAACNAAAVIVVLLGAYRFLRQQKAIDRGKVHAGGWEVTVIGLIALLVSKCPVIDLSPTITELFRSRWRFFYLSSPSISRQVEASNAAKLSPLSRPSL